MSEPNWERIEDIRARFGPGGTALGAYGGRDLAIEDLLLALDAARKLITEQNVLLDMNAGHA